jgi:hypothetical protein
MTGDEHMARARELRTVADLLERLDSINADACPAEIAELLRIRADRHEIRAKGGT